MPRPKIHDEALRARLLDAAAELVARQGDTFALRPLAESVGTSTTAIYSLFGSRGALLDALAERAATSVAEAIESVTHDNPMVWIVSLGVAYRRWAVSCPAMFRVMHGAAWGATAVREARARAQENIQRAVQAAIDAGLAVGEAHRVTKNLCAAAHGFILLETLGEMGGDDDYLRFLNDLICGYGTEKGVALVNQRRVVMADLDAVVDGHA